MFTDSMQPGCGCCGETALCDECDDPPTDITITATGFPTVDARNPHPFFAVSNCKWIAANDDGSFYEVSPGCTFAYELDRGSGGAWVLQFFAGTGAANYSGTAVDPASCTETVTLTKDPGEVVSDCAPPFPATVQVN